MLHRWIIGVLLLLVVTCPAFAGDNTSEKFTTTRGIKVVETSAGKTINLYHGSYALVVGNGNYKNGWDPLPGAVDDVKEVADVLKKYGFNVTLRSNLTREAFSQALNEFSVKYGRDKDTQLLIYYAGHGYTQKMANGEDLGYLVMVDTPLPEKDLAGFRTKSINMQFILTQAKTIQARHVLFMFDSCFSGSILSMRDRIIPKSISDSVKFPVRQFITAGRANEPVPDHSVFKQVFLDLLEGRDKEPIPDGYITGEELGLHLKNKVPEYNSGQHPQYGKIRDPKLDKGDFVFASYTVEHWFSKQKEMEKELKRLEAETERAESQAKEVEAKHKVEELKKKITEAKRKKEAAEKKVQKIAAKSDTTTTQTLLDAVKRADIATIQILLTRGDDVNARDKLGRTALMWAAMLDHTAVVKVLLENNANVNAEDKDGWTVLGRTEIGGKKGKEIIKLLKQAGAVTSNPKKPSPNRVYKKKATIDWSDKSAIIRARKHLRLGITEGEVRNLLGEPLEIFKSSFESSWSYPGYRVISFDSRGKVKYWFGF